MTDWLKFITGLHPMEEFNQSQTSWKAGRIAASILQFVIFLLKYILYIGVIIFIIYGAIDQMIPHHTVVKDVTKDLQVEYMRVKEKYKESPGELSAKIDSIWQRVTSIPVTDNLGKRAIINVYTLSSGYYWLRGSNQISNFSTAVNTSFTTYLTSEYFKQGYETHSEIICVGNSSYEESSVSVEECRSYCRAVFLEDVLKASLPFKQISLLPIGKSDSTGLNSNLQRSVIILGVKKVDSSINVKDALYLHLLHDNNIPFRFWDYSLCKTYEAFYNNKNPCNKLAIPNSMCK